MKNSLLLAIGFFVVSSNKAQSVKFTRDNLEPVHVFMTQEKLMDKDVVKVIKDSSIEGSDQPTFVKIKGVNFKNGVIEVKVLSRLLKNAPDYARGFIGVAFRIDDNNTKYESIYVRPINARVEDQIRRNHSIQYYSYPDFTFDRLRKESPEKYESYADMEMNQWITLRIEVKDLQAKLFLNNSKQPSLIVSDLKQGASASGSVGLWVDVGTEGYFSDLKILTE